MPSQVAVGQRVRVTQQVQHKGWTTSVEGEVKSVDQRKTGSWFAHAKDDRLWLDRLVLVKDDGEEVICNLDRYSRVELMDKQTPVQERRSFTRSGPTHSGASVAGAGSHPSGASVSGISEGALEEGLGHADP